MSKNIQILINISDISIITGDNPYKSKRDYLIELWQKNFARDDDSAKKFLKETDEQVIKKITIKNNIDISQELKKSYEIKNTTELANVKNNLISKINNLSEDDKKAITKSLNNVTNTTFGTNNENDIAILYNNMTNKELIKDNKYNKKCILKTQKYDFYIGGRIDGFIKNTETIIEIKNRIHKLFYSLRNYEKTQLMCYLYLFHAENGQLVEAYKKKDCTEINIINVEFDEIYMERIINKLLHFIYFFIEFVNDEKKRYTILNSDEEIYF